MTRFTGPLDPPDMDKLRKEYEETKRAILFGSFTPSFEKDRGGGSDSRLASLREKVRYWLITVGKDIEWDSIIGNDTAKTALQEAIDLPFDTKDLYDFYAVERSKGVLLSGPPGCGKTMLAKGVASSLARRFGQDMEMMLIPASALESKYYGETEANIRRVFSYAREYFKVHNRQLVIFMDECENFLSTRGGYWTDGNVNTFLDELDGLKDNGAFVILATNRPELIDEALLRDGRIDRKIRVERPTYDDALRIAQVNMLPGLNAGWMKTDDLSFIDYLYDPMHLIQSLTNPETGAVHHFNLANIVSGAMVAGLIARAKMIAMRRDREAKTMSGVDLPDLVAAVDEVYAENKTLNHAYALREFVKEVALPAEAAREALRYN